MLEDEKEVFHMPDSIHPHPGIAGKDFYPVENTISAQECTGLMPAMPVAPENAEALSELMAIHCPQNAISEDPAHSPLQRAGEHPYGVHNPRSTTPGSRPAKGHSPSRPDAGRNQ